LKPALHRQQIAQLTLSNVTIERLPGMRLSPMTNAPRILANITRLCILGMLVAVAAGSSRMAPEQASNADAERYVLPDGTVPELCSGEDVPVMQKIATTIPSDNFGPPGKL
jgi:hypothetical protein